MRSVIFCSPQSTEEQTSMAWLECAGCFAWLDCFSLETGGFCSEGFTSTKPKAGPQDSDLHEINAKAPDSPSGSISTTQPWSQSVAPNEHLNHLLKMEKLKPQRWVRTNAAARREGGEGNTWSRDNLPSDLPDCQSSSPGAIPASALFSCKQQC